MTADQKSDEARNDELTEADTAEELTEADTAEELTDAQTADAEGADVEGANVETEVAAETAWVKSPPARRGLWSRVGISALAGLLVASCGLTAWLFFHTYRPDQQTGTAASDTALNAAKDGTVAVLSYSPDNLDKDLDSAKSHLTGDFLDVLQPVHRSGGAPGGQDQAGLDRAPTSSAPQCRKCIRTRPRYWCSSIRPPRVRTAPSPRSPPAV